MATKGEIVNYAYSVLKINGLTVNPNPSMITLALQTMDIMVSSWKNNGLCLGYNNSESFGSVEPSQESGLGDSDCYAVGLKLAASLATHFGKVLPQSLLGEAKAAYNGLFSADVPLRQGSPFIPRGVGDTNDYYRPRYFSMNAIDESDCSTQDIKLNVVDSFISTWADTLAETTTITSFTITPTSGLEVSDSVIQGDDKEVFYKVKGITAGQQHIIISIVTSVSTPDIADTARLDFNVVDLSSPTYSEGSIHSY